MKDKLYCCVTETCVVVDVMYLTMLFRRLILGYLKGIELNGRYMNYKLERICREAVVA